MNIEEVDARSASDDVLARFAAIELACHEDLNPGYPPRSVDEVIAFYRHVPRTQTSCHWLANGGTAAVNVHGPTATFLELLVEPASRRRGLGTALLERALARCRELGVEALRSVHATAAGAAFAAAMGAVDEQRIVRSVLDLRAAELPEPEPPEGFRLVTWLGRVPDEHLDAYITARKAMDDAPAPEGMEFTESAEKVRASEESLERRDREMRLTVALNANGEIGSFTELRVSSGSTLAFTDDTGTVVAQRGKGLARAVKLESLRRLRADHPEVYVVTTSNAEENDVMRHLNQSIGFRPSLVGTLAVIDLVRPAQTSGNPR
ncbi:MAG TPA: GNAT family N-acetyltransferase [Gaiellaceae bacterium]|nr:GNAT family N-acetyltransferase [Gaiellaceae bacterium]